MINFITCILSILTFINPQNTSQKYQQYIQQDLGILTNDCIYMVGFYMATKYQFVANNTKINKIFYQNSNNKIYGLYMENNMNNITEYYKFMFNLDDQNEEIQIVQFIKSYNHFQIQNLNQTNINQTWIKQSKQNNITNQNSSLSNQDNISIDSKISPNNPKQTIINLQSKKIDITNSYDKDIYFPKINLVLSSIYTKYISNNQIKNVTYTLSMKNSLINLITYTILYYSRANNQVYEFIVNIQKNNLKIIKVPSDAPKQKKTQIQNNFGEIIINNTINDNIIEVKDQSSQKTNVQIENNTSTQSEKISSAKNIQSKSEFNETKQNQTLKNLQNKTSQSQKQQSMKQIKNKNISKNTFKKQAKYKTLINIIYDLSNIPQNYTAQTMQQWIYSQENKIIYKLQFKMLYLIPLPNDKIGNWTTIYVQEKGYQLRIINNTMESIYRVNNQQVIGEDQIKNKPNQVNDSIGLSSDQKQLINQAANKFRSNILAYTPFLSSYNLDFQYQSINSQQDIDNIKRYYGFAKFFLNSSSICYKIYFYIVNRQVFQNLMTSKVNGENILINEYQFISCDLQIKNQANQIEFQSTQINQKINNYLKSTLHQCQIFIQNTQKYQSYYRITYLTCNNLLLQIIIDSINMTIIHYKKTLSTFYDFQNILTNKKHIEFIENKIQLYLNTTKNLNFSGYLANIIHADIIYSKDHSKILKIDGRIYKNNLLRPSMAQYFTIFASFSQNQKQNQLKIHKFNFSNIINKTYSTSSSFFTIDFKNRSLWKPIPNEFKYKYIDNMLNLLLKNYSNFMLNSNILQIYESIQKTSNEKDIKGNKYKYKIAMKKIFKSFFIIYYAILIYYNQQQSYSVIQSIETLQKQQIKPNNCITQQTINLQSCTQCSFGFQLIDGICYPVIQNCNKYFKQMCRNCGSDDFENGFEFECPKYRKNKIYRIIESYNRYRGRKR